jgi:glyoxylase-like metal-dependent hydrolase (beta-lactamase superfamily II)/rhodanese-related sulfurtransferase
MSIICRQLNDQSCKTYLVMRQDSRNAIFIDPVIKNIDEYMNLLRREGLILRQVIDTHTHADHISGAAVLKEKTGCSYLMYDSAPASCADKKFREGDTIELPDGITAKVIYTPGHTKDSMSLVFDEFVFTGDALFLDDGGAGRDDLPGGDPGEHYDSLQKLAALPENLIVYPAHDYRNRIPSSLGTQKKTNPHFRIHSREEFVQYIQELALGPADWMKDVLKANYTCTTDPAAAWIPDNENVCEVGGTRASEVGDVDVAPITPADLKKKLQGKEKPVLLDVREKEELTGELGALKGIVHIPLGRLKERMGELDPEKETITICRTGHRATTAAQMLKKAGFPNVSVLKGGMTEWKKEK